MNTEKIFYKTFITDIIGGMIGCMFLAFVAFLLIYGGYWWISLPIIALIIYLVYKIPVSLTVYVSKVVCVYMYKKAEYSYSDIDYVEMTHIGKWHTRAIGLYFKDNSKAFIEYDGIYNCVDLLNHFKSGGVSVKRGQFWDARIKLDPSGKFQVS